MRSVMLKGLQLPIWRSKAVEGCLVCDQSIQKSVRRFSAPTAAHKSARSLAADAEKSPVRSRMGLMDQYLSIKKQHPNHLLLFRVGDFYELFFDDAVKASETLDIVLSKKGKLRDDRQIPMAGVPAHTLDIYVQKLIKARFAVAICEQKETSASEHRRLGLIRREVDRLITPGTIVDEELLDPRENNFLAAVAIGPHDQVGLAWLDITTGQFHSMLTNRTAMSVDVAIIRPKEVVMDEVFQSEVAFEDLRSAHYVSYQASALFEPSAARSLLVEHFQRQRSAEEQAVDASFSGIELAASGALIAYVKQTLGGRMPRLDPLARVTRNMNVYLDPATRRSLELMQTARAGERKGSLFWLMDRTATACGARLLASRLQSPSTCLATIRHRADLVDLFIAHKGLLRELRVLLRQCADIERCLQRLWVDCGGPRDIVTIGRTLQELMRIQTFLEPVAADSRELLRPILSRLGHFAALQDLLGRAFCLASDSVASDANFIASGYSSELDELRSTHTDKKRAMLQLQTQLRQESGIQRLSIHDNRAIGYYIEVTVKEAPVLEQKLGHLVRLRQTLPDRKRYKTEVSSRVLYIAV